MAPFSFFLFFFFSPQQDGLHTHTDLDTSNSHRTVWIRFCKYCITLKSHPSFSRFFFTGALFPIFFHFFVPLPPKNNKTKQKTKQKSHTSRLSFRVHSLNPPPCTCVPFLNGSDFFSFCFFLSFFGNALILTSKNVCYFCLFFKFLWTFILHYYYFYLFNFFLA